MTPISKQAAKMIEAYVAGCKEFEIHGSVETNDDFVKKYQSQYNVIEKVYWGDPNALVDVIERELFEYFQMNKMFKDKLKNNYTPRPQNEEAPNGVSIFVIAKR